MSGTERYVKPLCGKEMVTIWNRYGRTTIYAPPIRCQREAGHNGNHKSASDSAEWSDAYAR